MIHGLGYEPDLFRHEAPVLSLAPVAAADLPRRWARIDGAFPIYDQNGDNACVGFSYKECAQIVLLHTTGKRVAISPGFIWWLAKRELGWESQNRGCRISDAVAAARVYGAASEGTWEWKPGDYSMPDALAFEQAKDHPLLDSETADSILEVKTALVNNHPTIFGTALTESFDEAGRTGKFPKPAGVTVGGHAMVFVGYDDDIDFGWAPPGGFLTRNHWKKSWGLDGLLWVPYSHFDSYAVSDSHVLRVVPG